MGHRDVRQDHAGDALRRSSRARSERITPEDLPREALPQETAPSNYDYQDHPVQVCMAKRDDGTRMPCPPSQR